MQDDQERKREQLANMGFFVKGTIGKDVIVAEKVTIISNSSLQAPAELSATATQQTVLIEPTANPHQNNNSRVTFNIKKIGGNAVVAHKATLTKTVPHEESKMTGDLARMSINSHDGKGTFSNESEQTYGTFQTQGNNLVVEVDAVGDKDIVELSSFITQVASRK